MDGQLQLLIQRYAQVDVAAAYAAFQQSGQQGWKPFLDYLYHSRWVAPDAYSYIRAQGEQLCGCSSDARRYELLEQLGEGGMGEVRRARDLRLHRSVAYKSLKPGVSGDAAGRFLDEAQVAAQLDHPNIVTVYGLEVGADGAVSYAMKLVEGKELAELLREAREARYARRRVGKELALETLLEHFLKVCDAIAYAHSRGVLHRDLKPQNIMIGRFGEVYVMDWGISRKIAGADVPDKDRVELRTLRGEERPSDRTLEGQGLGTPRYMSPEQAQGRNKELDGRSDLYTLGLILQEIVTLEPAISGTTRFDVLTKAVEGRPDPIAPRAPGLRVPRPLRAIIVRATRADRQQRYLGVAAFAEDIRRFQRGEAVSALPDGSLGKLVRWIGRHSTAATLLLLVLVAACGGTVAWSLLKQRDATLREHAVSRFQTAVARQAQRIDSHFLATQERLRGLAHVAALALTRTHASEEALYSDEDFAAGRVPGAADSRVYGKEVSPRWPVYKLAPGLSREAALPELRRLAFLNHDLRMMFAPSGEAAGDPHQLDRLITEVGVPIRWAFVGLVGGVMYSFPGKAGYAEDYDPRVRPWYLLAAAKRGVFWGPAYQDAQGQGLLLPCAAAIWSPDDAFLGVAGLDVTVDYVVEHLLALPGGVPVGESFLIDGGGAVVVRSGPCGEAAAALAGAEPGQLPFAEARAAVRSRRSGSIRTEVAGAPAIVVFHRLDTLGWSYVAWAEAGELLAAGR